MVKKKIDVKLKANRFTYDPDVLSEFTPVAIQARLFCGPGLGVVYMQLTPRGVEELYEFLERVLVSRYDDREKEALGNDGG